MRENINFVGDNGFSMNSLVFKIGIIIITVCIIQGCRPKDGEDDKLNHYAQIDREIEMVSSYDTDKTRRIRELENRLTEHPSPQLEKEITDWLIEEFESYNSDSALYYINKNLVNPIVRENRQLETSLLIKKADIAAHAGLFGEATEILKDINPRGLDSITLENYYSAYCDLYQYQSEYATNSEYAKTHEKLRELYIDSIAMIASPASINYVVNHAASSARNGNFGEAEKMLLEKLDNYNIGNRNYSILSSILADIYKQKGDKENYIKYISNAVISDIRGSIKENMAIRALATECYENGDLERADRYLRQSFADANFYSARMRNAQSSRMLPVIGEAYTTQQKETQHQLRVLVTFVSILAAGFILISIFAFIQVRKVRVINKKTKEMLDEVSTLSNRLKEVNGELSETNRSLQGAYAMQKEYSVLFLEYCSLAISALQQYQQSLKVAAAQGNIETIRKKIDSTTIENKTLGEFYSKFDEAILNLYPNFVEKFNSILKPEERISLKPNESLNTELRVFALIKIGINDSEKIAKFLRCSLTTVYTYRSKTKKKALNPDSFDEDLMKI